MRYKYVLSNNHSDEVSLIGEYKREKVKSVTKNGIIIRLYKDGFINERVFCNLLGSKFKKFELLKLDRTFRKYLKSHRIPEIWK